MDTLIGYQFAFIIVAAYAVFFIFGARWGWQDARERGLSKLVAMFAALLVVVFFPIGLILWLCLRPPIKDWWWGSQSMRVSEMKMQNRVPGSS